MTDESGADMLDLMRALFPICRSITGDGLRASLRKVGELVPLTFTEVPSGTAVLDWVVPPEWNLRAGWLSDPAGQRVADFHRSNLEVLNYSAPVHRTLSLEELRPHLHSLPAHPTWVPYRTSYYNEDWGFCLSHDVLEALPTGDYEAVIDSTLEPGSLTYGECVLPGTSTDEVLISSHICHPSLANDNLSGVVVAAFLAQALAEREHRYTYRFLFAPGTIGAIAWLARNEAHLHRIRGGLVLACVGDDGDLVYKKSRRGDTEIDRVAAHVLGTEGIAHTIEDFSPYGNDERQFCSPGFDLPVGAITRSNYERAVRHHTSADDISSISGDALGGTLQACLRILEVLDANKTFVNLSPKGEPQLGRRGLYRDLGGRAEQGEIEAALLWLLSYSDGQNSLLDIAARAGLPFRPVQDASLILEKADLLGRKEVRS